jgi:hypothetical protein
VVTYKGKPVPDVAVNLINPERWSKTFQADANGRLTIPTEWSGRYLLAVNHPVEAPAKLGGKDVAKVWHTSTTTFVK